MQVYDIIHVFNSSLVSGPETLILPNTTSLVDRLVICLLQETRVATGADSVLKYAESLGHRVFQIAVRRRFDILSIWHLRSFIAQTQPKIVHTHGPKAGLFAALSVVGMRNKPILITTHHGVRATDTSRSLRLFQLIYEKVVMPLHDLVLTVCTSDRELLIAKGIQASNVVVHLNGTDRDLIPAERTPRDTQIYRSRLYDLAGMQNAEIPEQSFHFAVVARLAKEKRHTLLLDALAQIRSDKIHVYFFGNGPLDNELKEKAKDLDLSAYVHFLGYQRKVYDYLPAFDGIISLSQAEGLPINLIEAAWAGVPIIATAVDGVRDLIIDKNHGYLLPANPGIADITASIQQVMSNPKDSRAKAICMQSRVAAHFSRDSWLKSLEKIYKIFDLSISDTKI
jgi:glycosyltransferase involved in cell wall biosynthesis